MIIIELFATFNTVTTYRHAFRILTNMLKPKPLFSTAQLASLYSDSNAIDADEKLVYNMIDTEKEKKQGEELKAKLESRKVSLINLMNTIQSIMKSELSSQDEPTPTITDHFNIEHNRLVETQRAQILATRLRNSKEKIEQDVTNLDHWLELGNSSCDMYYKLVSNLSYLSQGLKAYGRLNKEYVDKHSNIYIKRAFIHMALEEWNAASSQLSLYSSSPSPDTPTQLLKQQYIETIIQAIHTYVKRCKDLIDARYSMSKTKLSSFVSDLPSSSKQVSNRTQIPFTQVVQGQNNQVYVCGKILGALNVTSKELYELQNATLSHSFLSFTPTDNLSCLYLTPLSYLISDRDGNMAILSIYNTLGKKILERGDVVVVVDPHSHTSTYTPPSSPSLSYPVIQVINPNMFYVNYSLYDEKDVVSFVE